jgi:uncharacterized protein (UPF0333 family)
MTRAAGFVLMVIVLALSGYTFYEKQFELHRGGQVHLVRGRELAYTELRAAAQVEAQAKALVGTYRDTSLRTFKNLKVIYANDVVYCLQVHLEGDTFHVAGPGGEPADGPC